MAPTGQGTLWSEVLCCPLCSVLFSLHKPPVNLSCGHAVCRVCLSAMQSPVCPLDQTPVRMDHKKMPVNWALLSILGIKKRQEPQRKDDSDEGFSDAEAILIRLSSHLHKADSERGGSIWSDELSRPLQRKLFSLICLQLLEDDGRYKALKMIRSLSERIICELLIAYQNASHISSNLWSAVRARGCQFLGPAMQEEVLRLILLTLSEGALIARKTLVMYIVQTLTDDYPQVSKTCVGHVVQLLYRASCFNVIKRDGESSLMQLKTEFRDYESLRREHDSQIVQVAIDAGLRISPDQWSSLLYGDQSHRSHMQSIIDKLQSPQTFTQLIKELSNTLQRVNTDSDAFSTIITDFEAIDSFDLVITELPSWSQTVSIFEALDRVLHAYVRFNRKRAEQRSPSTAVTNCFANLRRLSSLDYVVSRDVRSDNRYKTRLCRDVEAGRACRRGLRCTYAHCDNELRRTPTALKPSLSLPIRGENGSLLKRINECDGFVNDSNDTATLQHNIVSCMSNAPPTLPRLNSPRAPPPPCNAQQITAPNPGVPIIPMRMPPQPPNQNAVLFDSAQPIQVPLPVVPVIIPPARYIDSANSPNAPIQIAPQNQMRPPVVNQQMMMSRVWPNGMNGTQGLSNAMIAPNTVIQFPIHAPPPPHQPQFLPPPNQPQLHINHNQNALQWTQNCVNGSALNEQPPPAAMIPPSAGGGALQMNLPLECVETQWNIVDRTTCRSAPVQPVAAFEEIAHHGEMNNYRIMKRSEQEDEEQLMMRRKEIISRLVDINQKPNRISVCEESFDEDDLQSHVSYTVASSVLYDDKDTFTSTTLHLPPLPLRFTSASNVDDAVNCLSDLNKTTTVLTVCPPPCVWTNIAKPATVQSPCSVMTIKDMINLPLATPAIQRSHVPHLAVCQMKDSNCIPNSCVPPVIRPLPATSQDPQNVVSETLDRIVDVRERLNDVEKNSGLGCSVEKQQLKEELNIINRQIQTLDQQTKQSCLLKELEVVDKKIEHLNVHC